MRGSLRRLAAALDRLEEVFMAAALAVMTVVTFTQVVLRAFGTGFVWSLEVTTYTFAWLVLIGMSYGVRTHAHIAVDLVTSRLNAKNARLAAAAALAAGLAYCLLMAYGSIVFVDRLMTLGNDARDIAVPRWALASVLPVGFALLGLRLVQGAWAARSAPERTDDRAP